LPDPAVPVIKIAFNLLSEYIFLLAYI